LQTSSGKPVAARCCSTRRSTQRRCVYFHIAMAYAILRHNGVDIGKMDFLGPIKWIDA
jgi:hypothetical protein